MLPEACLMAIKVVSKMVLKNIHRETQRSCLSRSVMDAVTWFSLGYHSLDF